MKSIVCVNATIPTVDDYIDYCSHDSIRDYDIAVFNPVFPYFSRTDFTDGDSCISISETPRLTKAISHWSSELLDALKSGKTVFVILDKYHEDKAATSSTMPARNRVTYNTSMVNNYAAIPTRPTVKNVSGRKISVGDPAFRVLYESVKDIMQYQVVLDASVPLRTAFTAKDGAPIGGVVKNDKYPGSLVLLPYVDFEVDAFAAPAGDGDADWTEEAMNASRAFVGQLVAIDKHLRGKSERTPAPNWVAEVAVPKAAERIESDIATIDLEIECLRQAREEKIRSKEAALSHSSLLYETGKPLEHSVEAVLRLLGYAVETLRIGDLEIDHVIVGPSGKRMIGETEGKDTSAVDISKFRQLESNIGEDFERDAVSEPAKGLLFGNGFRLTDPGQRAEQFTAKSLKNAARLGVSLVRTVDLYPVAIHLVDNPDDEAFKVGCRSAIEETAGSIVQFPRPTGSGGE